MTRLLYETGPEPSDGHGRQVDEPLYAHYLTQKPTLYRPYRDRVYCG
jgi:hypothetical protein